MRSTGSRPLRTVLPLSIFPSTSPPKRISQWRVLYYLNLRRQLATWRAQSLSHTMTKVPLQNSWATSLASPERPIPMVSSKSSCKLRIWQRVSISLWPSSRVSANTYLSTCTQWSSSFTWKCVRESRPSSASSSKQEETLLAPRTGRSSTLESEKLKESSKRKRKLTKYSHSISDQVYSNR